MVDACEACPRLIYTAILAPSCVWFIINPCQTAGAVADQMFCQHSMTMVYKCVLCAQAGVNHKNVPVQQISK